MNEALLVGYLCLAVSLHKMLRMNRQTTQSPGASRADGPPGLPAGSSVSRYPPQMRMLWNMDITSLRYQRAKPASRYERAAANIRQTASAKESPRDSGLHGPICKRRTVTIDGLSAARGIARSNPDPGSLLIIMPSIRCTEQQMRAPQPAAAAG